MLSFGTALGLYLCSPRGRYHQPEEQTMAIPVEPAIIPHLVVDDAAAAIDFYVRAFDGTELARAEADTPGDTFDADTDQAVRAFQQQRGLIVDGIVGPATYRALREASYQLGARVLAFRFSSCPASTSTNVSKDSLANSFLLGFCAIYSS